MYTTIHPHHHHHKHTNICFLRYQARLRAVDLVLGRSSVLGDNMPRWSAVTRRREGMFCRLFNKAGKCIQLFLLSTK